MWNWEIRQNDNTSLPTDSTDHDQLETTCKTEANLGKPYENILLDNLEFNIPVDPSNNNGEGLVENKHPVSLVKKERKVSLVVMN